MQRRIGAKGRREKGRREIWGKGDLGLRGKGRFGAKET